MPFRNNAPADAGTAFRRALNAAVSDAYRAGLSFHAISETLERCADEERQRRATTAASSYVTAAVTHIPALADDDDDEVKTFAAPDRVPTLARLAGLVGP
jgi:hypothetical protein